MTMRHLRGKTIKACLAVMFPPKMKMSLMFTPQNLPGTVFNVAHLTHVDDHGLNFFAAACSLWSVQAMFECDGPHAHHVFI